ncbi:MAG TPA: trypsin-like peptidase domain-containing protein [Mycobacterium sp.]|uniref:S1C family serine protease n=1 Tax=Mycobacterium sp. TaxID=1785 RepID=UPI002D4A0F3A|nr:trypsin-like peptidase domain-containing protein [Mycobacterium sp.]HZU50210.1 trypsin-like peptidase domain-containing protein [Mycobacterium sp.]
MTQARHVRAVGHTHQGRVPLSLPGSDGAVHEPRHHKGIHRQSRRRDPVAKPHIRALTAMAAVAVISAGIGAGAATAVNRLRLTDASTLAASQAPAASAVAQVEQVAAKVVPAVVKLQTDAGAEFTTGSGIVLSPDGLILTNDHVVSAPDADPNGAAETRTVATLADGRVVPVSVVASDPASDLAVVRAHGVSGLTPITFGSSAQLHVGQTVVAVGSPLGLTDTVSTGIISALHRRLPSRSGGSDRIDVPDAIQTDAAMNPGSSGGALVDMTGALVGVNCAIAVVGDDSGQGRIGSTGLGFAIPADHAKRVADALIAGGAAPRT